MAEGVGILNLIKEINSKIHHVESGEIVVYSDMKIIINDVQRDRDKESQCIREGSATVLAIKQEIENSSVTISLEYSNTRVRVDRSFQ